MELLLRVAYTADCNSRHVPLHHARTSQRAHNRAPQARLIAAATEQGLRIPGLMANAPPAPAKSSSINQSTPRAHQNGSSGGAEDGGDEGGHVLTGLDEEGEGGVQAVTEGVAALSAQ